MDCFQPNVRRQATFSEPEYGIGCCVDAQRWADHLKPKTRYNAVQNKTRYAARTPNLRHSLSDFGHQTHNKTPARRACGPSTRTCSHIGQSSTFGSFIFLLIRQRPTTTTNVGVSGGADRDRTGGLLVANQALSQLSYSPKCQVSMLQGFRVSK